MTLPCPRLHHTYWFRLRRVRADVVCTIWHNPRTGETVSVEEKMMPFLKVAKKFTGGSIAVG
jgi:hypothetical protein